MKTQTKQIFLCLVIYAYFAGQPNGAADFSRAKQTYVPPSYIQRNLDALGPGLSSQIEKIQSQISSLADKGHLGNAENLARNGLKYFPNSSALKNRFASITVSEAQAFVQMHNYDLAGKKARESLVADPNNKAAKIVIGKVLKNQGLDPNLAESHVIAGDKLTADNRLVEAAVEYKLANEIKPNPAAHVGLGNLALGKGQLDDASHHFERALSLDPNFALAYRQRGVLRYILHDSVSANTDFSKAVTLNPKDTLASDALIGLWKQQVSASPNSANSHLGLARAYLQTHNLEAARNEYKAVVALDPNHPALPAARASFKIALAKEEADKAVQAAKTLDSQGALKEAHQKLIEAIDYYPSDPQILLYHGQICEKLGLAADAHDAYMSVLKVDPKNVEAAAQLKRLGYDIPIPAKAVPGVLSPTPATQSSTAAPPASIPNQPLKANPLPDKNLHNAPLKSPLSPNASSQIPFGNAYYDAAENVYIGDPVQVTMLGNFGSCVRALIMAQKQFLQMPNNNNRYTNDYSNSENLSTRQNNGWF